MQKIVIIITLLCALVLSNAYKNDSLYSLIKPKEFRPYMYFYQLVQSNYSILSEPFDIGIRDQCAVNAKAFEKCVKAGFKDNHNVNYLDFGSSSFYSVLYITSYIATRVEHFGKKLPKQINTLYKYSKLWTSPVLTAAQQLFEENNFLEFSTLSL